MAQFMQIYQTSRVFPHGGQMVNNQTISLGSNICYLLAILKKKQLMSVKKGRWMWRLEG